MKWRNHALMAGATAFVMGLHPVEIAYCMAGANLPDQLEKIGRVRIAAHRTWTHELLVWLLPMLLFGTQSDPLSRTIGWIPLPIHLNVDHSLTLRAWVLFLPGLLHLAGDVMTPKGVKLAGRKISMRLFSTGQPMEYVVTALFVLLAAAYHFGI